MGFTLQADEEGKLKCYHLEVVVDMPPAKVQALPPDAVIVQFTHVDTPAAAAVAGGGGLGGEAVGQVGGAPGEEPAEHFLELLVTGQVNRCDSVLMRRGSFLIFLRRIGHDGLKQAGFRMQRPALAACP